MGAVVGDQALPAGSGVDRSRRKSGAGRRKKSGGKSPRVRWAPSTGVESPDGIPGPGSGMSPRMYKSGQQQRLRGSRRPPSKGKGTMRYAGIDIASEKHFVAIVDETCAVLEKSTSFSGDNGGYSKLFRLLGQPMDVALVAMEATGHYWKNLFAALTANGFRVALLNPVRTNRFAAEEMERTKTDAIDALGIARFAAQKQPLTTKLADSATEDLKELVRLRDRLVQDLGDRVRELHRVVDLGFPEFTRYVRTLDSDLATSIFKRYRTAEAFIGLRPRALSNLKYDGRHFVGLELANQLIEVAAISVGRHHGEAYRVQVTYFIAEAARSFEVRAPPEPSACSPFQEVCACHHQFAFSTLRANVEAHHLAPSFPRPRRVGVT